MKTFSPKESELSRDWYVVDAEGQVLGRLASKVAAILRGKHKPQFARHLDNGDFVIIINAEKVRVTGNKAEDKIYYRHSGYPGGLKSINFKTLLSTHPTRIIEKAVKGMLPKNRLGRKLYTKLKVYAGPDHPHSAQQPILMELN